MYVYKLYGIIVGLQLVYSVYILNVIPSGVFTYRNFILYITNSILVLLLLFL